ncbi:hypothetical protein C8F04DRAFT_1191385 [Mycena alexandri]|uniref:Uncharacterized protein n=1 Tax=Mycena alexandri TaxID=1745969 RepID=A0AAD6WU73_9AGAR|nr:hypothetical protein C8F04DRAFT_1191385 [Mycena alexandri]
MNWHPILDFWASAIPPGFPEPRIINGAQYAGIEFHELSSPWYPILSPTIPLTEWWGEERDIKDAFKTLYPQSPPHPDRANSSPSFLRDSRRLVARLACAHAIFLLRSALYREEEKIAAAAAEVEDVIQLAMAPLLSTEYLAAWLNLPGYKVFYLGLSDKSPWSSQRVDDTLYYAHEERVATGQTWPGWGSAAGWATTGWDTTWDSDADGTWGSSTGGGAGWDNSASGTSAWDSTWANGGWAGGGGWDARQPRRGRQFPKNLGRPFHPPRRESAPRKNGELVRKLRPCLYIEPLQLFWRVLSQNVAIIGKLLSPLGKAFLPSE